MSEVKPVILIVDDEERNRKLLHLMLEPEGYQICFACDADQTFAAVAEELPDLILLDVMLPGVDGFEIARLLKEDPRTADIPIIMVTAHDGRAARVAGLSSGAEEFLTTPVDLAELQLRVRNLLRLKQLTTFFKAHNQSLEAEIEARTSDLRRYCAAMDATADGITMVSRKSMRFVEANVAACALFGYLRTELVEITADIVSGIPRAKLEEIYDDLIAGGNSHVRAELPIRRRDGSDVMIELTRHAYRSDDDWVIVGVHRDITARMETERRLHRLAHFDSLTGLPNRALFNETLDKTLVMAGVRNWAFAVLLLDLDHFKNVNDTLGHDMGDELLKQVAGRLSGCLFLRDTLGRLGGDEFGVIVVMEKGETAAAQVAEKFRQALVPPFLLREHEVQVTASIGITLHPADASNAESLLKFADTAMYRAKQQGRDTYRFFTAQMNVDALARLSLDNALRQAVERSEFVLHYQPKVSLRSGCIVGVEALLRWDRPGVGLVSPGEFIPALEESGLIVRVGSWVIASACKQLATWAASANRPVQISVNVAYRQFIEGDLEADIIRSLEENNVPAALLELEMTETTLMANSERTIDVLQRLRTVGVRVSLDDFGTGYSSLAYLRRFPLDKLKIDIAFIREVTTIASAAAIAQTIIRMGQSLQLDVIAEGVETDEQLAFLRNHGCDEIQGYLFSRPLPLPLLEELLLEDAKLGGGGRCIPVSVAAR